MIRLAHGACYKNKKTEHILGSSLQTQNLGWSETQKCAFLTRSLDDRMNTNLGIACSEAGEGVMLEATQGHVGVWLGSFNRHFLYPSIHALIHKRLVSIWDTDAKG